MSKKIRMQLRKNWKDGYHYCDGGLDELDATKKELKDTGLAQRQNMRMLDATKKELKANTCSHGSCSAGTVDATKKELKDVDPDTETGAGIRRPRDATQK